MSELNVDLVVRAVHRLNEGGVGGAHEDIDPEIEFDLSNSDAPDAGIYHGLAQWRAVMGGRMEELKEAHFEVLEITEDTSDNLVVVLRVHGQGRASGLELEAEAVTVWTIEKGKVSRIRLYRTRAEARKAVGLEK